MDKNFMGADAEVVIDGTAYPCTSKDLSIEPQTEDSQFDDSDVATSSKGVSSVDLSGSLEYDGQNVGLRDAALDAPEQKHRLIIREDGGGGIRFKGVILSFSRDYPSDGKASSTVDWEAESYTTF
jgi:hypothetical protein